MQSKWPSAFSDRNTNFNGNYMEIRCKACDKPLESTESVWRRKVQRWEDLCGTCLAYAYTPTYVAEPGAIEFVEADVDEITREETLWD